MIHWVCNWVICPSWVQGCWQLRKRDYAVSSWSKHRLLVLLHRYVYNILSHLLVANTTDISPFYSRMISWLYICYMILYLESVFLYEKWGNKHTLLFAKTGWFQGKTEKSRLAWLDGKTETRRSERMKNMKKEDKTGKWRHVPVLAGRGWGAWGTEFRVGGGVTKNRGKEKWHTREELGKRRTRGWKRKRVGEGSWVQ